MNIKLITEVKEQVEVNISLDDVVDAINEEVIAKRWNCIAKLINGISISELQDLEKHQLEIIEMYLKNQHSRVTQELKNRL